MTDFFLKKLFYSNFAEFTSIANYQSIIIQQHFMRKGNDRTVKHSRHIYSSPYQLIHKCVVKGGTS